MFDQNFVYLGILTNAFGSLSYFIDVIKGKIQPSRVSFALWSIFPLIAFFAEVSQKVGVQSLLTLSVGVFPLIILLGTFVNKKAYWKITRFDLVCGFFSFVGLFLWYLTKVGNWAIFFSILADGFAAIPTLRKSYLFPETESAWQWITFSLSGFFTLLTVKTWDFATIGYPLYILVMNFLIFTIIQFKIGKLTKRHQ